MNSKSMITILFLLASTNVLAETDGRFLYVSESNEQTDYILSDGPGRDPDIKSSDIDEIVKEIGQLGHTGSMNYIAVRVHGQIKISSILPILKAIEANPTWELAILQRGDGIRAGIVMHHLDNHDPNKIEIIKKVDSEKGSE